MTLSPARRVASVDDLERAGDYTGPEPVEYPDGLRQQVWFLLPVHRGTDMFDHATEGSGLHGVSSPPWDFRECPDGSLEIRASIGCGMPTYYWHGYLDAGNVWRQVLKMDDCASGVYYYLSSLPDVLAVVGSFPADDPDNSGVPWIFVRNVYTRMEDVSIVKGSQAVSLVLCYMGQGSSPMDSSTIRFQRLEVDIWVDPLRDPMGNVTSPSETEGRGLGVFAVLDSHLHRVATDQMSQQWGDLITVGSLRMSEPVWYAVPDGDGLIRGVCFYDVGCFGWNVSVVDVGSTEAGSGGDVSG